MILEQLFHLFKFQSNKFNSVQYSHSVANFINDKNLKPEGDWHPPVIFKFLFYNLIHIVFICIIFNVTYHTCRLRILCKFMKFLILFRQLT